LKVALNTKNHKPQQTTIFTIRAVHNIYWYFSFGLGFIYFLMLSAVNHYMVFDLCVNILVQNILLWDQTINKNYIKSCMYFDIIYWYTFNNYHIYLCFTMIYSFGTIFIHNWSINSITEKFSNILTLYEKRGIYIYIYIMAVLHHKVIEKYSILIGYYTVLCTIWKDIVRVCIVLKTRIGRDATGVQYRFSVQYGCF
jgi:hypothetical protein